MELRKLQLSQLDIALEVKNICEKHNINYFLIGGTLLGAIRHGGFIPWDDDLDIGMLRCDYNRFISVCETDLINDYFLQTALTDKEFGFAFAKVKINGTQYVEEIAKKNNSHKGIFIDIFPFDNMPEDVNEQKKHNMLVKLLRVCLLAKCGYLHWDKSNKYKQKIMNIINFLLKPVSKKFLLKTLTNVETKYSTSTTESVINLEGSYNYKEFLPLKSVKETQKVIFEGYQFSIPSKPEVYLTNLYGDYMKLPPEEKRANRHDIINVDLGNYIIKNIKVNELNNK